jgi:hypothetical protein
VIKPVPPNTKPVTPSVKPGLTRPPTAEERRRAQRVLLKMTVNVIVSGKPKPFEATTHTVSQNGAMILLPENLPEGTKMILENPKSQKTVEAKVVRPAQHTHEGALTPVEFLTASPSFWNVFFPPVVN